MTKYSDSELQEMASVVESARANGDMRYLQFIMSVALRCGIDPQKVMRMSRHMASPPADGR